MAIKLTTIVDDDSNFTRVSQPINHGDFPFVFIVDLLYTRAWDDEWADRNGEYHVEIKCASARACGPRNRKSAMDGINRQMWRSMDYPNKCAVVARYGCAAVLWQSTGRNKRKLLKQARQKLVECDFMFGFVMDRPQNAIGNSGWDCICGDIGFKHT